MLVPLFLGFKTFQVFYLSLFIVCYFSRKHTHVSSTPIVLDLHPPPGAPPGQTSTAAGICLLGYFMPQIYPPKEYSQA
jgi:hypothetical protein